MSDCQQASTLTVRTRAPELVLAASIQSLFSMSLASSQYSALPKVST